MADSSFDIGDTAPGFELADTEGRSHAVPHPEETPPATVIIQTCNHCPYVIGWNPRLRRVAEDYAPRGVRFLQINSNDDSRYPADSFERMQQFASDNDWPIPYLHDESQDVARALGAQTTPHVFVLDSEHRLRYHGAPDADHQDESHDAAWLRAALDAVLAGQEPERTNTPPRGCSVKWR
jgi:AhpC/TSA family protein